MFGLVQHGTITGLKYAKWMKIKGHRALLLSPCLSCTAERSVHLAILICHSEPALSCEGVHARFGSLTDLHGDHLERCDGSLSLTQVRLLHTSVCKPSPYSE